MEDNNNLSFGLEDRTLSIRIPRPDITNVENILRAQGEPPKSISNITRLYSLIKAINSLDLNSLPYQDIADMLFSGHTERLTKALSALENAGLVKVNKRASDKTGHKFNTYTAVEVPIKVEQVEFEFSLPDISFAWIQKANSAPQASSLPASGDASQKQIASPMSQQNKPIDFRALIYDKSFVYVPIKYDEMKFPTLYIQFKKKEYESGEPWIQEMIAGKGDPMGKVAKLEDIANPEETDFFDTFKSWYDEISIYGVTSGDVVRRARDGRLSHEFHRLHKEDRPTLVRWEGEPVEEIWDAHSAIFAVIGYYIKQKYNGNDKDEMIKEADALIDLTLENRLYEEVMLYYKKNGTPIDRENAKRICNTYRSIGRNRLIKKNGDYTSYKNVWELQNIDKYFIDKFPHIRAFFLDYHKRKKLERKKDNSNVHKVEVDGGRWISFIQPRNVSNLQKDVMPYELKLISLGICRVLYKQYGIKSITVHDAIYTKKMTDEEKQDVGEKIEDIYRTLLGRNTPVKTGKATGRRKVAGKEKATSVPLWGPEDEVVLHYEHPA